MKLKYGMNPYQDYAEVIDKHQALKLKNGNPSVINVLDALNAWQLVKEIHQTLHQEAGTSFKHVTPSGVAIAGELSEQEKRAYLVKQELSPLASSYAKARGTDRLASFGDFIAFSHPVDVQTALLIKSEVSDGLVAPGFSDEALAILSAKKNGGYVVFEIDPSYEPEEIESRDVFGITIKQKRNNLHVTDDLFSNVVALNQAVTPTVLNDLKLGVLTLKYTQSNSICVVNNGHVIGIGSGQQSRILCSNLALTKANIWYQKSQLDYSFLDNLTGLKRTDIDQVIEQKREDTFSNAVKLNELPDTCLLSDGFFPQKDNLELAHQYGVKYIATPMGSIRDNEIIEAANRLGITLINTGVRWFHH